VQSHFGVGGLIAVALWSELGDCRRFSRSMQVVRHAGLDVTVDASDRHRAGGHLSRQGPQILRWALYEAAKSSSRQGAPDHAYYAEVKQRHDGKLAALAMARKLARRCYHTLRSVDPALVYAMP
jgi:transposase